MNRVPRKASNKDKGGIEPQLCPRRTFIFWSCTRSISNPIDWSSASFSRKFSPGQLVYSGSRRAANSRFLLTPLPLAVFLLTRPKIGADSPSRVKREVTIVLSIVGKLLTRWLMHFPQQLSIYLRLFFPEGWWPWQYLELFQTFHASTWDICRTFLI